MAKNPPKDVKFKYGACKTDHKPGDEMRNTRHIDFMNQEPYASRVKETLEKMGLPQPEKNEVFRGTHHDLLFLDSHGVMLRIGPTDVPDLMNPAVIQPLGWVEDKTNPISLAGKEIPFTIAVYPGIELYRDFLADKNSDNITTNLEKFLQDTGQDTGDLHAENLGIVRVKNENGKEVGVKLLLDPDNVFNASNADTGKNKTNLFALAQKEIGSNADAMEATIGSTLGTIENAALYQSAFEVHQPLRRMFSNFMESKGADGKPDQTLMKNFWNACASTVNNPQTHFHNMAHYRAAGPRHIKFSEQKKPIETVLYRPWTGNSRDGVAAVKKALANAKKPPIQRAISRFIEAMKEDDSPAAKRNRHQPRLVRNILRKPLVQAMLNNPLAQGVVKLDQGVNFLLVGLPREAEKMIVKAWKNMKEKNAPAKQQQGHDKQSGSPDSPSKPASSAGMFSRHLHQGSSGEVKKAENGFDIKPKTMSGVHGEKGNIFKLLDKAKQDDFKTAPGSKPGQKISYKAPAPKTGMSRAPSPGGMKK